MLHDFLPVVLLLFGTAILVIALSQRLRLPAIAGFLLTGIALGPHGSGLIRDPGLVDSLAELGIVFLLFMVGLEMSFDRMKRLGRIFILGGPLQALFTAGLTLCAGPFLPGRFPTNALYIGFILIQSSTAIVLKLYQDRGETGTPHSGVATGILLFQDLLIIPLLLLIPILGGSAPDTGTSAVALRFGLSLVVLAAVFFLARLLLPYVLRFVVRTGIRELLVLSGLVLCLGAAAATAHFGFSMALGAFLAGILIGESEYASQVQADAAPFRDVFNSLFFISIGMLTDLSFTAAHPAAVGGAALGIMVLKFAVVAVVVLFLKFPARIAIIAGFGMAHIGEFAFVLLRDGAEHGLIADDPYRLLTAASVLTMLLAPLLITAAPELALRVARRLPLAAEPGSASPKPPAARAQVVIVGYGLMGRHMARVLKAACIPYSIVELDGRIVHDARAQGEPITFGDAARREILERCGVKTAQVAVLVISDPKPLLTTLKLCRQINPGLFVIARTRRFSDIELLQKAGADEVISEEFETSIEIFTSVLTRLHIPRNLIRAQTKILRDDGYQMMRVPSPAKGISDKLALVLSSGTTDTFYISPEHAANGRTLQELNLRGITGAMAIAVVREEKSFTNPPSDFVLRPGDTLVLVGSHAQIDAAFDYLEKPKNGATEGVV